MCTNGFNYYKIPDQMDNVTDISGEMIFTKDLKRIIKDVYPDVVLEEGLVTKQLILSLLEKVSLDNAKLILSGKNLVSKDQLLKAEGDCHVKTEKWFKTQYITL